MSLFRPNYVAESLPALTTTSATWHLHWPTSRKSSIWTIYTQIKLLTKPLPDAQVIICPANLRQTSTSTFLFSFEVDPRNTEHEAFNMIRDLWARSISCYSDFLCNHSINNS